jgi:signal transduction histidine kinase
MLNSASTKLDRIKRAGQDFEKAASEAEATLNKALARLQEAKTELANRAAILSPNPNLYFQGAVQRLGEARRAIKATPPQAITCYRLATEALTLIEDALQRARDEVKLLRDGRINARNLLQKLQDIVTETKLTLNQKDAVPVKAKDMYTSARDTRDSLTGVNIDTLSPQELDEFAANANKAIKLAETALGLLRK